MANALTPLGRRVLVKRSTSEEKTAGGLYLPDTAMSSTTSVTTSEGTTGTGTTGTGTTDEPPTTGMSATGTGTTDVATTTGDIPPMPFCGDGVLDPGEGCDDGAANADDAECTTQCQTAAGSPSTPRA